MHRPLNHWIRVAAAAWMCLVTGEILAQDATSIRVAVAFSDASNPAVQWDHLRPFHNSVLFKTRSAVFAGFENIVRCKVMPQAVTLDARGRSRFDDKDDADYALHFIIRRLDKFFRNRTTYQSGYDYSNTNYSAGQSSPREIIALPVLSAAIEVRLILLERGKVMWSTLQDSTVQMPHGKRFVYNPEKYPGFTHPEIMRDYVAPILRQRLRRPSALRMLTVADRWYLSDSTEDITAAGALLKGMIDDLMPQIDARLPLYGSIISFMGADKKNRQQFQLDLGTKHGIVEKARLDVFRQSTAAEKVGQVEIVSVDSSSSVARLRKLERSVRKRGETLAIGDRVISRQRPPQFGKRNTQ